MFKTTAGQLLVNYVLPPDLKNYDRVLDKKNIQKLFNEIALKYPDKYRQIVYDLSQIGHRVAYFNNGFSFHLDHLKSVPILNKERENIVKNVLNIYLNKSLSPEQKINKVVSYLKSKWLDINEKSYQYAVKTKNPLALQVLSGTKGNPANLQSLIAADILYVDRHNQPIPIPVIHNYSQGLTPAEYFSGLFGARKGMIDNKFCLAFNTEIRLYSGGIKKINKIQPGDDIFGITQSGEIKKVKVVNVYNNGLRRCFYFIFQNIITKKTISVVATKDHRIAIKNNKNTLEKRELGKLDSNKIICVFNFELNKLDNDWRLIEITQEEKLPTFDIEVDDENHLFLLSNGLVVENSTQDAGFLAKQLNQIAHPLLVTALDSNEQTPYIRGLPVDVDDPDNVGALLAAPVAKYPVNTVLTPEIIDDLKSKKIQQILVRSPLTSSSPDGGVYARDVGIREKNQLPPVGDFVGIAAAQALSEPLSQAQLSSKHSGGIAGQAKATGTGFKYINQLIQVPEVFPGGATHAKIDGVVKEIKEAPQGGYYIFIENQQHYVPAGKDLKVKKGQSVEAGDVLSDGIPNPAEIVFYKGIGEGRRYFTQALRDAYKNSDLPVHRRNVELIAKGLINHVRLVDEWNGYQPDEVILYSSVESSYKPRSNSITLPVKKAIGKYLESPVLHYTIGTKIRPSVVENLQKFGINEILVHEEPPPFVPEMIRGLESVSYYPNWLTKFLGSHLKKNLLKSIYRGDIADLNTTSYIPRLAEAENFGRVGPVKGWKLQDVKTLTEPPQHATDKFQSILSGIIDISKTGGNDAK